VAEGAPKLFSAEQDNRVKFPDGTAAVSAAGSLLAKASHWTHPGRQTPLAEGTSAQHKSEDLRMDFFHFLRDYGNVFCRGKTAASPCVAQPYLYFRRK